MGPGSNAGGDLRPSVGGVAEESGVSTCTEWTFDSVDGEEIPVELLRRRARGDANLPPDPSSDAVRRPAREGAIQAACGVGPVEENFAVGP
jgi:hypothetical protein